MTKAEARAALKRLQAIVSMRADEELPQVLAELQEAISSTPMEAVGESVAEDERKTTRGRDRKERGGRNRSE